MLRAVYMALEAVGVVLMALMLLFGMMEAKGAKENRCFIGVLASLLIALLSDFITWWIQGIPSLVPLAYVMVTINYIGSYLCVNFFLRYLCRYASNGNMAARRLALIFDCLCTLSILAVLVSLPFGYFFTITPDCVYILGKGYLFANLYSILALTALIVVVCKLPNLDHRERILFLTFPIFPLVGVVVDYITKFTPMTYIGGAISLFTIYLWIFTKRGQKIARQEAELSQSRISIMLSQIQPHFLYNALNSIGYLCEKDPAAAKKAVDEFSVYLRGNLDSIKRTKPVPFEKELEHVRIYLSLEQMRFDEDLHIIWDTEVTVFLIPALTVQPLVENAVKYGVGKKVGGGTVTISTAEWPDCFEVTVADDGVGYDPCATQEDGRTHIGIENVRARLAAMVDGTLDISTLPGKGTRATITIPKEAQNANSRG